METDRRGHWTHRQEDIVQTARWQALVEAYMADCAALRERIGALEADNGRLRAENRRLWTQLRTLLRSTRRGAA